MKIIKSYEKLNDIGIKTVNYQLMLETLIKVIILAIAFLIQKEGDFASKKNVGIQINYERNISKSIFQFGTRYKNRIFNKK